MRDYLVFLGWFSAACAVFFLVVVLGSYRLFWELKPRWLAPYKVRNLPVAAKVRRRELTASVLTFVIVVAMASLVYALERSGLTLVYRDAPSLGGRFGWLYLVASFFALNLLQDAYFYWTHRALHEVRWLARFHRLHHGSYQPSPLSAFSFHPVEGIVNYAFFPLVIFVLPLHPWALGAFFLFLMTLTVVGHLGFELYPRNMFDLPFFRHFNSATHHDLHHELYHYNFGLYYSFWDKWCGTLSDGFEARFERAASGAPFQQEAGPSSRASQSARIASASAGSVVTDA